MKKYVYTLLFFVLISTTVAAQMNKNRQRIKALKTSYITDELELTSSEAEKFWPIYNLYNTKIQKLRSSTEGGLKRVIQQEGGLENITEEQAKSYLDKSIFTEKEIAEYRAEMMKEFLKILPAKRIIKLHKIERAFNKRMLQEYGNKRRQNTPNR